MDALQNKSIGVRLIQAKLNLSKSVPDYILHLLHEETSAIHQVSCTPRLNSELGWRSSHWTLVGACVVTYLAGVQSVLCDRGNLLHDSPEPRLRSVRDERHRLHGNLSDSEPLGCSKKHRGTQRLGWDQRREWVIKTNLKCHLSTYSLCFGIA